MFFFGKKTKYPLPKFPASVIPTFKMLVEVLDGPQLEELSGLLEKFQRDFRAKCLKNPSLDFLDAEKLVETCRYLLDHYHEFDDRGKGLVIAAVRYVAVADDPFSEDIFSTGFFDDKRVVNHVLEELGIEDHYINVIE